MKSLDETKAAIIAALDEGHLEPAYFRELVRAVRAVDGEFSYYAWIYSKALNQLEAEGLVWVTRGGKKRRRNRRTRIGPVVTF